MAEKKDSSNASSVRVNEATDTYELGFELDGAFVPFVQIPGPQVRATVENVKAAQAAETASSSSSES